MFDGCASGRVTGGAEEYAEALSVFHELLSEGLAGLDAARAALDGESASSPSDARLTPPSTSVSDKPAKRRHEHARAEARAQSREVATFEIANEPEPSEGLGGASLSCSTKASANDKRSTRTSAISRARARLALYADAQRRARR